MPACGPGDTRPEHHQSLVADPPEPVPVLLAGLPLARQSVLRGLFFPSVCLLVVSTGICRSPEVFKALPA